jgi:hypothetical protein
VFGFGVREVDLAVIAGYEKQIIGVRRVSHST